MPVYALGDLEPRIDPTAFVHPDAVVIGDVEIGPESSIWPGTVLRGDNGSIRIGARSSIQDGSVVHCIPILPTTVGDNCVIGHIVHLEGCTVEDAALVGNGSVVLHRAIIRTGSLVGSNAVVPDGMEVPTGMMALGVPARLREGSGKLDFILHSADDYVKKGQRYRRELRRLD
ncbi:MAG: gamma carbonic anhydrase family protein [Acidimicrobiales bacterium]|nr:gamma carbonic anhydrase family protein [Acidimicrobiales bacterium]